MIRKGQGLKVESQRLVASALAFLSLRAASEAISLAWGANRLVLCEKSDSLLLHHKEIAASLSLQGCARLNVNAMTKIRCHCEPSAKQSLVRCGEKISLLKSRKGFYLWVNLFLETISEIASSSFLAMTKNRKTTTFQPATCNLQLATAFNLQSSIFSFSVCDLPTLGSVYE